MTIVSLRGTHGSGKSTVATSILKKFSNSPRMERDSRGKKPLGYAVTLQSNKLLYIVGPYVNACGGCDTIQPFSDIWPRVEEAQDIYDHVLFEGALVSTTYGQIGKASEAYGDDFVFAFLDTPLIICTARVNARRAARGAEPLADTKNIDSKWHTIDRLRQKLATGDKLPQRRTVIINHKRAVAEVLRLFQ